MLTRYIYTQIIFRLLIIVIASIIGTWLTITKNTWLYTLILGIIIVWVSIKLIYFINNINQKVACFFNAIENEDSTLHYPEAIKNKSFKTLNKSLNRVNQLVQDTKITIREQEQYYSALLEQVSIGIVVINNNGNILQANLSAKNLLKYQTLTHINQLKRIDKSLFKGFEAIKNGSQQELVSMMVQNNSTQLTLRASEFRSQSKHYTLIAVQDIRNELETKEAESWIKLIRVLTHEIMNSISPITSLSETLLGYYQTNETIDEQKLQNTIKGLEVINERGIGLIKFVENYRRLTKVPQPILQPLLFDHLLQDIKLLMLNEPEFNKIHLKVEYTPDNLTLNADKELITQVLINLIKNALHALKHAEQPTIKIIGTLSKKNRPIIQIIDNGNGIPPEILDQIFIPFFTTKADGSGIGLSLSKQIMRLHSGNIEVLSDKSKGTKFSLTF